MADRKTNSRDYAVGYGRPPKATRFQPGQSGNPKGRPRGSRPVGAILQEALSQKIAVTECGKTKKMSVLDVMFRRLTSDALRGDLKAIKLLLGLQDRYANSPETSLDIAEITSEDRAILESYLGSENPSATGPNDRPNPGEEDAADL